MRTTTAIKPRKTTNWDSANALTGNAEIAAFVADALETNGEEYIAKAKIVAERAKLKNKDEHAKYVASLSKKVQEAIDDPRPSLPHSVAVAEWEKEAQEIRESIYDTKSADLVMRRVKNGTEKIYTSEQVKKDLGL
jgi:hypothetical protein